MLDHGLSRAGSFGGSGACRGEELFERMAEGHAGPSPRKVKSISGARRVVGCVLQGVRGVPSGPAAKPFFNVALSGGGCVNPPVQ